MKKVLLPALLMTLTFLFSCSAKSGTEADSLQAKGIYPDLVMENTYSEVGQDSGSPIILNAEKMILYSEDGYARLENFSFTSLSENGETETEGRADRGTVQLDGSRIELEGNVTFSRPADNMMIKAESLVYNKESDEITTKGSVVVNSDEGTIEGEDFKGDLRRGVYSFSAIGKGDFALE